MHLKRIDTNSGSKLDLEANLQGEKYPDSGFDINSGN